MTILVMNALIHCCKKTKILNLNFLTTYKIMKIGTNFLGENKGKLILTNSTQNKIFVT